MPYKQFSSTQGHYFIFPHHLLQILPRRGPHPEQYKNNGRMVLRKNERHAPPEGPRVQPDRQERPRRLPRRAAEMRIRRGDIYTERRA